MNLRSEVFPLFILLLLVAFACGRPPQPGAQVQASPELPTRASEFNRAAAVYGALTVRPGWSEGEADARAWSSWWYPINDTYLFQSRAGTLAPLEKYDLYLAKTRGKLGRATAFERDHLYDPKAAPWEGLCNAWASAASLAQEPRQGAQIEGLDFGVGDLKALLVKSYDDYRGLTQFGQRYNGDRLSNYDDIYPEQFHRVLVGEMAGKSRGIIMDRDPSVPVWNTPVWAFQSEILRDEQDPGTLHVTTWLSGSSPFVDRYDFVGTLPIAYVYTYDLIGEPQPDGSVEVTFGHWTGKSQDDHPDFLSVLPEHAPEGARPSRNAELDSTIVDEILSRARRGGV